MIHPRSLMLFYTWAAVLSAVIAKETQINASKVVRQERMLSGCSLNVCFALDGSESVSPANFRNFRSFVRILVRRLSNNHEIGVAGVQYGFLTLPISPLTNDIDRFIGLLRRTDFEDAEFTRVSGGMLYCFGQLRSTPTLLPSARIVILGSGEAELGVDPEMVAGLFEEAGGSIFGIGVDTASTRRLGDFLGSSRNVFTMRNGSSIRDLVDTFIPSLCRG